ncbi:MAG: hypothetical protein ABEK01_00295 [Candidatus Nanohaloarchaea archaeon]
MASTFTDWMLYNVVGIVFTPDEWHAFVLGLTDGISLRKEGKFSRRVVEKAGVRVADSWALVEQKAWYYNAGYSAGEFGKLAVLVLLAVRV